MKGEATIARFRKWRHDAMADFPGVAESPLNMRPAKCRVCRCRLPVASGIAFTEFMEDGYRCSVRYVCEDCETETRP